MLYRPNFCCHCGEKIVRSRWTPLTSRRFCEFCAVEQQQHDLLPRAGAVIAILVGMIGVTAYLGSGKAASSAGPTHSTASTKPVQDPANPASVAGPGNPKTEIRSASNTIPAVSDTPKTLQRGSEPNSSTEAVYYCGAMTKKGTSCTRRVKTPGRCWQHRGQTMVNPVRNRLG